MRVKICVAFLMAILLTGCVQGDGQNDKSSHVSTPEIFSSDEVSSDSLLSTSGYTSMELVRHDPLSEEEFEKVTVTDIELLNEIDKRIIEMIENEKNPSKPKMPAQGGMNYWIRCYKDTDMKDEYSIAGRSGAKKVDGKFAEYYDTTDSDFYTRLAEIVLPENE